VNEADPSRVVIHSATAKNAGAVSFAQPAPALSCRFRDSSLARFVASAIRCRMELGQYHVMTLRRHRSPSSSAYGRPDAKLRRTTP
jgi:hypothetical protein